MTALVDEHDQLAALREQARRLVGTPPGQLRALLVGLMALCLVTGVASVAEIAQRRTVLTEVTQRSIPLASAALEVYQSLSEADATANSVFLAGDQATTAQRSRYFGKIEQAAVALSTAATGASVETTGTVAELTAQLTKYVGLVETAHTNNRHGFSVGAAYLREASALVRETLLPAAHRLYRGELERLAAAQRDAGSVAWIATVLGTLALAALVAGQFYLRETTRRTLNAGLLVATLAMLVAIGWLVVASANAAGHSDAGRRGMDQTDALAEVRISGLTARSMEALALVAKSSGTPYEEEFRKASTTLDAGAEERGSLAAAADRVRDQPQAKAAVDNAIGIWGRWKAVHEKNIADEATADRYHAAALSTSLDETLASASQQAQKRFEGKAVDAVRALGVADAGAAVLTLVAAIGVGFGMAPRIREYR